MYDVSLYSSFASFVLLFSRGVETLCVSILLGWDVVVYGSVGGLAEVGAWEVVSGKRSTSRATCVNRIKITMENVEA